MTFDIPQELKIVSYCAGHWLPHRETMELIERQALTRQGKKFFRYTFNTTLYTFDRWSYNHARLFICPQVTEGSFRIYYQAEVDGKRSREEVLPVEIIRLPRARTPRRFKTGFNVDYTLIKNYPDFARHLKHLGFNHLVFNYNVPFKRPILGGFVSAEEVRELLDKVRDKGFTVSVMGSGYFSPRHTAAWKDLQAIDIEGERVPRFDFTARGPWMEECMMNWFSKSVAAGQTMFISNWEPFFTADRISFTPRTLEKFRQYFKAEHPAFTYVEPIILARNPGKYPQQEEIWINFKVEQVADFVETIVNKVKERYPEVKIGWCNVFWMTDEETRRRSLKDHQRLSQFLDFNMPMIYDNIYKTMSRVGRRFDTIKGLMEGTEALLMPTLCAGLWDGSWDSPPQDNKFIILEAATSGAQGYWIFPGFNGATGLDLRYISEANTIIARAEEVFWYGERRDDLVRVAEAMNLDFQLPVEVNPKLLVYENEMVLFVSEYSASPIRLRLDLHLPWRYRVIDLDTNEEVGILDKENNELTVHLKERQRARIFLLQSLCGRPLPAGWRGVVEEVAPAEIEEEHLILSDSFEEGKTRGKDGTPGHFFTLLPAGGRGGSGGLFLRDYQSSWLYERELALDSGNLTVEFWWKPTLRTVDKSWTHLPPHLFTVQLDDSTFHAHFFEGRLRFAELRPDYPGRWVWGNLLTSRTDRWGKGIWYHIVVSWGRKGMRLLVNGVEEARLEPPLPVALPELTTFRNIRLGVEWMSRGIFDELRIYNR